MKLHRTITNTSPYHGLMSSRTVLKLGLAAALVPVLGACSPSPLPISRSSSDPSSPSAPPGISPLLATVASVPVPPASPGPAAEHHEHHDHDAHAASAVHADHDSPSGTDGVVYVCPMHPEVTSTKAGELCPKCNMKLVPKK